MVKMAHRKNRYGLVGRNISYSFSKGYFTQKFMALGLNGYVYENFDIPAISDFPELIRDRSNLRGLNVTIPYKEAVIPYLAALDPEAEKIGAVNTIVFTDKGLIGYNTDAYGFLKAIEPFIKKHHTKALILGTGGASKAVAFVLENLGIVYSAVSRHPKKGQYAYQDLNEALLEEYTVLINCTPLGTHPNVTDRPGIPYQFVTSRHLLFDLIYNPKKTAFLLAGESRNATICNGLKMLEFQAEKAWELWNTL
ncbi:shikimate dehydrogenase family protein [Spongiimicrobium sp. 2-473A-2-J]|uniref:shikimate dehydrogenase family protein n=1 Tax=Eudoraea algarum TaxID=3417568 RepID=UPI003D364FAF